MKDYKAAGIRDPRPDFTTIDCNGELVQAPLVNVNAAARGRKHHQNREARRRHLKAKWAWKNAPADVIAATNTTEDERAFFMHFGLSPQEVLIYR